MAFLLLLLAGSPLGFLYLGRWRLALVAFAAQAVAIVALAMPGLTSFSAFLGFVVLPILVSFALSLLMLVLAFRQREVERRGFHSIALYSVIVVAWLGANVALVDISPYTSYAIRSSSMAPTLERGDVMLARKLRGPRAAKPALGDVIVYRSASAGTEPGGVFVKRVVGVPGDRIAVPDGFVLRNGRPTQQGARCAARLTEPASCIGTEQIARHRRYDILVSAEAANAGSGVPRFQETIVPAGTLFVLGDNRENSVDSRTEGPIADTASVAAPLFVTWTRDLSRIGRPVR